MIIAGYFYTIASLVLTAYVIVSTKMLLSPLLTAFILSLALKPIVTRLESYKIPKLISTSLTMAIFILFILLLIAFFSNEVGNVNFATETWKLKLDGISGSIQKLITDFLGVSPAQQEAIFKQTYTTFLKGGAALINNTLSITTSFISSFVIFIIALFFFIYYRTFLVSFLYKIFKTKHHKKLAITLQKIQVVINSYIFGLFMIILAVAIMNTIGLLILDIPNAILFGTMAAVLTLMPYIGILIGAVVPMIFAFFTKDSLWYPIAIMFLFMFVQFIEGNFLTPNIVGKQIRVNPFVAILALITGGLLLGIVGVIFALPIVAILKVICDEVPDLEPIGYLLGNPKEDKLFFRRKSAKIIK